MTEETEQASMDFMSSTRHITWHEALVIYLIFFGVCAFIFALIRWRCNRETRNVLLITGGLTMIAGALDLGIGVSYAFLGHAMLVGNHQVASEAMFWYGIAEQARFSTVALVAVMCFFTVAAIIGIRKSVENKE